MMEGAPNGQGVDLVRVIDKEPAERRALHRTPESILQTEGFVEHLQTIIAELEELLEYLRVINAELKTSWHRRQAGSMAQPGWLSLDPQQGDAVVRSSREIKRD